MAAARRGTERARKWGFEVDKRLTGQSALRDLNDAGHALLQDGRADAALATYEEMRRQAVGLGERRAVDAADLGIARAHVASATIEGLRHARKLLAAVTRRLSEPSASRPEAGLLADVRSDVETGSDGQATRVGESSGTALRGDAPAPSDLAIHAAIDAANVARWLEDDDEFGRHAARARELMRQQARRCDAGHVEMGELEATLDYYTACVSLAGRQSVQARSALLDVAGRLDQPTTSASGKRLLVEILTTISIADLFIGFLDEADRLTAHALSLAEQVAPGSELLAQAVADRALVLLAQLRLEEAAPHAERAATMVFSNGYRRLERLATIVVDRINQLRRDRIEVPIQRSEGEPGGISLHGRVLDLLDRNYLVPLARTAVS